MHVDQEEGRVGKWTYVRPVDLLTPARNAETVGKMSDLLFSRYISNHTEHRIKSIMCESTKLFGVPISAERERRGRGGKHTTMAECFFTSLGQSCYWSQ